MTASWAEIGRQGGGAGRKEKKMNGLALDMHEV